MRVSRAASGGGPASSTSASCSGENPDGQVRLTTWSGGDRATGSRRRPPPGGSASRCRGWVVRRRVGTVVVVVVVVVVVLVEVAFSPNGISSGRDLAEESSPVDTPAAARRCSTATSAIAHECAPAARTSLDACRHRRAATGRGVDTRTGSSTTKRAPPPTRSWTHAVPPIAAVCSATRARPSPVPMRCRAALPRANRSKIRSRSPCATPGPPSSTASRKLAGRRARPARPAARRHRGFVRSPTGCRGYVRIGPCRARPAPVRPWRPRSGTSGSPNLAAIRRVRSSS